MRRDLTIAALAALLAVGYLVATYNIQVLDIGDSLGPRAYPAVLGVCLLVAAVMIFFETRRRKLAGETESEETSFAALLPSNKVMLAIAMTFVFISLFEWLGFLLASSLYLFAMMYVFHPGRHMTNALVAILFSACTYVVFHHLLGAGLPAGLLSF